MAGWHHWFSGHELGQTPGDRERQGDLECCSPWGCRVGHDLATEQQKIKSKKKNQENLDGLDLGRVFRWYKNHDP